MNRLGYLIKSGFTGIFSHGLMSFATVTIIMACLIIMGSFGLLVVNINEMIAGLESENETPSFSTYWTPPFSATGTLFT